jgi:hypothetical protein
VSQDTHTHARWLCLGRCKPAAASRPLRRASVSGPMAWRSLGHCGVAPKKVRLIVSRLLWTCGFLSVCTLASAQTDEERAGARALADQGATAFDEGRWSDAVDLFTRAQSVIDAPIHLLYIARAQEKQGNLVQAMEAYIKASRAQLAPNAPPVFQEAKREAEAELEALTPRLPQVTVTVSGADGVDDVVVKVDGEPLPAAFVGVKRPANPGKHTYSAEGATLEAQEVTIAVNERGEASVELVLRPKAASTPLPTPVAAPAEREPAPAPVEARDGGSGSSIPAYAALGVGAVGLGVGTYFLLERRSAADSADALDDECRSSRVCDGADASRLDALDADAASFGTYSMIGYGVGAVGVGVGLYLLLSGGDETASVFHDRIGVWATNDQVGIAGSF